jgi:peptide/nickel transport system permease protein
VQLILRRLVQLAVVLLIVSFFSFCLVRLLPGDPTKTIIPFGTDAQRAQLKKDLGLDEPFLTQYVNYVGDVLHGDFGHQYSTNTPVSQLINQSLPVSLELIIYAQLIALAIAIPLGVIAAYRAGTRTDAAINTSSFAMLALPNFVLALLISYFLGAKLKILPTGGYAPGFLDPLFDSTRHMQLSDHLQFMFWPALALAVGQIAIYMHLLRSDMVATLQENFITMARAKGISNRRILWRHALRPSSLTLLTVAGLNIGTLIGGAIVVEVIFNVPGMGEKIYQSVVANEYVELQSYILVIAFLFVIVNFFVDFLYAVLDPRIRRARTAA